MVCNCMSHASRVLQPDISDSLTELCRYRGPPVLTSLQCTGGLLLFAGDVHDLCRILTVGPCLDHLPVSSTPSHCVAQHECGPRMSMLACKCSMDVATGFCQEAAAASGLHHFTGSRAVLGYSRTQRLPTSGEPYRFHGSSILVATELVQLAAGH